jgi:hypothetical protein
MKYQHVVFAFGIYASTMASAPVFAAEDGKAYPGSACQRQFDNINAPVARTGAILFNNHTSPVKVFCPVVKDIEAGRIKRAEVMVDDNHALADIRCELFSFKRDGSVQQVSVRDSSGTTVTPLPLAFGAHGANPKGSYGLTCELPVGSGSGAIGPSMIVGYTIVEE